MLIAAFVPRAPSAGAGPTCHGEIRQSDHRRLLVLPVSALSVGLQIWPSSRPDTSNPASPILPVRQPISADRYAVGWEPARLADVTMKPWFPRQGHAHRARLRHQPGLSDGPPWSAADPRVRPNGASTGTCLSAALLDGNLTDFVCFEQASFDIAYMTEIVRSGRMTR